MSDRRVPGFDVAKFLAMLMIVFIHVRAYAPPPDPFGTPVWVENFCTLSAVPLFFMVGGLFARRLFEELSFGRLLSRTVACLWPVLTMCGICGLGLRAVLGQPSIPWSARPAYLMSVGWFFFSLVVCDGVTYAACFLSRGKTGWRCVFLAGAYLFLWALPVGMFHAVEMLPFFWFGAYAMPRLRVSRFGVLAGALALTAFLLSCCLLGDFRTLGLNFHLTSMRLLHFTGNGLALMLGRLALGLVGAYGLLTAVLYVAEKIPALGRLSPLGRQTMDVFFIHIQILSVYYALIGWTGFGVAGRIALTCAVFAISQGIAVAVRLNAVVGAIVWNPLSFVRPGGNRKRRFG